MGLYNLNNEKIRFVFLRKSDEGLNNLKMLVPLMVDSRKIKFQDAMKISDVIGIEKFKILIYSIGKWEIYDAVFEKDDLSKFKDSYKNDTWNFQIISEQKKFERSLLLTLKK